MTSSTSNFKRSVPSKRMAPIIFLAISLSVVFLTVWELNIRSHGFAPALDDKPDLWAINMEKVKSNSTVFIGASRHLHNMNIYKWEELTGVRPIQLSIPTSDPREVLSYFANETKFEGVLVIGMISGMFFSNESSIQAKTKTYLNFYKNFNLGQRISYHLGSLFDHRLAFMEQIELSLLGLIKKIPLRDRVDMKPLFRPIPYFTGLDENRNAFITKRVLESKQAQQNLIARTYEPIHWIVKKVSAANTTPKPEYNKFLTELTKTTKSNISKIQSRGGKVVIIYHPSKGALKEASDIVFPKSVFWDRIVESFGADSLIHYQNYADLLAVPCCIDNSHLSPREAKQYTAKVVRILTEQNIL